MSETVTLSDVALAVLRLRISGQEVEVTDETRDAYRELAEARLMVPVHTFTGGRDSHYRFTEEGWSRRGEFQRPLRRFFLPRR
jgi:hypothetical protein